MAQNLKDPAITVFVWLILFGFFLVAVWLFQESWNRGLRKAITNEQIAKLTYTRALWVVLFIFLTGYFFARPMVNLTYILPKQ